MSKRIVLVDAFGFELFSGKALGNQEPREEETPLESTEDARQGGPLESGIFFRGSPRLRKVGT
jgi:hypothetical protein